MRLARALFASLAALGAFALAEPARAGIEDTFGLGPKAMALGGSYAARPGDAWAAYYNPAGLSPGGGKGEHGGYFELGLGFVYAHPSLHVTRANGSNIPTPDTPDTAGAVVGTRFSAGQLFGLDGLDMGLALYVPTHLFRWAIYPDDDVQWGLLTDRTQVVTANWALGYRVTDWLSLGAGLRIAFDVQTLTRGTITHVGFDTDPQTGKTVVRSNTQLGTDAQVYGKVSPIAGVLLTPLDELRIGVTYHHKSYVDDWGNTRITNVPLLSNMGYNHHFAHYFEPTQVTVAADVDVTKDVDVSADLTWAHWSEALSTNRNYFSDYCQVQNGSSAAASQCPELETWGDTWIPALGVRWQALRPLALSGGYRFQKSPLGNYGGPDNLLDNDRHVVSMGLELDVGKAVGNPDLHLSANFAVEHVILVERTETKDYRRFASDPAWQQNPGYPSYSFGGHLLATSFSLEAHF